MLQKDNVQARNAELCAPNFGASSTASASARVMLNLGDMSLDSHLQVQQYNSFKFISEPQSDDKHVRWHLQRGTTGQSGVITMSSREIAKHVGAQHDSVLKTVRSLVERGIVSGNETPYSHPQNGQIYPEFLLDYRNTMVVVSGYSVEVRARIVDRWMELEASKAPALPDFNNPVAAARAWADAKESELKAVAALEQVAPKVKFFDTVVDKSALMTTTQIAQKLGMSAIQLNKYLDTLGVYAKGVKRARVFKQWVIDKGLGVLKQTEQGYSQPLFTTAGEAWIVAHVTA